MNSDALLFLIGAILLSTLLGAVLLRAAIALYNVLAGGAKSTASVPEPEMGKALGITLAVMVVNWIVGFILLQAMAEAGETKIGLKHHAISFPISLLVMAGMLTGMLPTRFGRAVLVTLCYLVVCIVVGAIIAAVASLI